MWGKKGNNEITNISKGIKKKREEREKVGSEVRVAHKIYGMKTILSGRKPFI